MIRCLLLPATQAGQLAAGALVLRPHEPLPTEVGEVGAFLVHSFVEGFEEAGLVHGKDRLRKVLPIVRSPIGAQDIHGFVVSGDCLGKKRGHSAARTAVRPSGPGRRVRIGVQTHADIEHARLVRPVGHHVLGQERDVHPAAGSAIVEVHLSHQRAVGLVDGDRRRSARREVERVAVDHDVALESRGLIDVQFVLPHDGAVSHFQRAQVDSVRREQARCEVGDAVLDGDARADRPLGHQAPVVDRPTSPGRGRVAPDLFARICVQAVGVTVVGAEQQIAAGPRRGQADGSVAVERPEQLPGFQFKRPHTILT